MMFSRRIVFVVCLAVFFAGAGRSLFADDKDKKEPAQNEPAWVVKIEVLMVAMPQEKFIELLPDLQDETKIEKVIPDLWEAIKKKEMILRGYPIVVTRNGQRAVSETIQEIRYPTEFLPPAAPSSSAPSPTPKPAADFVEAWPTAFETRNAGVTMEVEPVVSGNGEWIDLNIVPQDVELLEFDSYLAAKKKAGEPLKAGDPIISTVDQPRFFTMKTTTSISLRNGQYVLLATHKMMKPEGYVDVFIVHAGATMVK